MTPTTPNAARFLRQMLVSEVGEAGQRRICGASASVGAPGLAGEIATLYARRAGFGEVTEGTIDVDALAPLDVIRTPAARAVAAGARTALAAIRLAIDVPKGGSGQLR